MISFFFFIIIFIFVLELILFNLVQRFKKKFRWLINNQDEKPNFSKKKLENFYNYSYDKNLGWDRKKNSRGFEKAIKKTFFFINNKGSRGKELFNDSSIAVFGDSFAFCRYVNDNETWERYLEKKLRKNVFNFGVGNYGLDQSFLKYKKIKANLNQKIILFNFVPETIARINSYWKHYREFGNILGFKPIFYLSGKNLILKKNLLEKFMTNEQIHNKIINVIKKFDIFYEKKFKKKKFYFPYSLNYFQNFKYFSKIFLNLILFQLTNKNKFYDKSVSVVLNKNIKESHLMYNNKKFSSKLKRLINLINHDLKKDKKKMLIIITPQLIDLRHDSYKLYTDFYRKISKKYNCIDATDKFLKIKNFEKFFFKDKHGGHLNKNGNKFISNIIYKELKERKFI